MNLLEIATRIASTLIDAGMVAAERKGAATAVILAQLRQSPPDVTTDYHAARDALLGPDDELPRSKP